MNFIVEKLKHYIDKAESIVIVGHYNPDGDAIGSSMGLYNFLCGLQKKVQVIMPNPFPENLRWMDKGGHIKNHQVHKMQVENAIQEADLLFCMDFQALNRTDKLENLLRESKAKKVLIDHHIEPKVDEFDLCFSDTKVSSTCELCYRIVKEIYPNLINKDSASCFYAGICTDTGSFSFSCRHAEVFAAVADLIGLGIDPVAIHRNIFDTFSEQRLRLLGYCLSERLIVLPELNTAYIYLTKKELNRFNYQAGDTEGIVNYALSIENVYFAAFFTERDNRIRISFRSKGNIDVNLFARDHFDGGGHKNASGGNSYENLQDTLTRFKGLLPDFHESFKQNI